MITDNLNGLLQTIREDKTKVLNGLKQQDQERNYKTPEVIAILELSFALVETSIMTLMEAERTDQTSTASSMLRYQEE